MSERALVPCSCELRVFALCFALCCPASVWFPCMRFRLVVLGTFCVAGHVNHHIHGGMMALYEVRTSLSLPCCLLTSQLLFLLQVREEMAAMHMPMPEAERAFRCGLACLRACP